MAPSLNQETPKGLVQKYITSRPTVSAVAGVLLLGLAVGIHLSINRVHGWFFLLDLISLFPIIFFSFILGILLFWWHSWRPINSEVADLGILSRKTIDVSDLFFQPRGIVPWLEQNLDRMKGVYTNLERVSQLLSFINYSAELPRQVRLALNMAHEIFPRSVISVFLWMRGEMKFCVASLHPGTPIIQELSEGDPQVISCRQALEQEVDLEKLRALNGKTFSLPLRRDNPGDSNLTVLPLVLWNRILGAVVYKISEERPMDNDELVLASLLNRHIAVFVENHYLYKEKMEQERITHEVEIARQIQMDSIPRGVTPLKGFDIFGLCTPCNEMSGDYFDMIPLSDNRLLVTIADVSGKGFPAALFLSKVQTLVRAMAQEFTSPAKFLCFLSSQLAREEMGSLFATMLMVYLKAGSNSAICSNAGHCKPLVVRTKTEFVEEISFEDGIPLGLFETTGEQYIDQVIELLPADGIFLYTDGLSDMVDAKRNRYGVEGVKKSIENTFGFGAKETTYRIIDDMNRYKQMTPLEDDVTMVYIKFGERGK